MNNSLGADWRNHDIEKRAIERKREEKEVEELLLPFHPLLLLPGNRREYLFDQVFLVWKKSVLTFSLCQTNL